jgi:hypothetical protein
MTSRERADAIVDRILSTPEGHYSLVGNVRIWIREAIDAAVAEEREACAVVADHYGTWWPSVDAAICRLARNVARAIRARGAK